MPAVPHRPSIYNLQRFLLGTLPPAEAAAVAAWVESSPDAVRALAGVAAHDALTKAVASTVGVKPPPAAVVARVVASATGSYVPAAESVPDVADQTRPSAPAARRPGAPDLIPERIGPFRIVRELGRGGMGVVYEATDEQLGRRAAVKVLGPDLAASAEARQRFLREGRSAADLKSDHIVTIYQVGEEDGVPFLAMEFIEGVTLETWRKTRSDPVSVEDVLWVARDLLSGLAAAHKKGRVHRDVKPANALIERETRRVKLLDFGLTRGSDEGDQLTSVGRVLGTPAFMSPEQANGKAVDARSDLFSVGVTLYAMVAGRSPFARDSVMATLLALATEEPPPAALPEPLRAFVARLMSKNPAERPADAGAAFAELRTVEERLKSRPAPKPKPPPLPPAEPETKRAVAVPAVQPLPLDLPEPDAPPRPHRIRNRVLLATGAVLLAAVVVLVMQNGKDAPRSETAGSSGEDKKLEPPGPVGGGGTSGPVSVSLAPIRKDSRVYLATNTPGYSAKDSATPRFECVYRWTPATVLELPAEGTSRCLIRLDTPGKEEVWVLFSELEAE